MVKKARPTLRDVARLSNSSIKTVSRVINSEPNVRPELIERVEKAIRQLNYHPNYTAGTLRRSPGKTGTIAVLVDDIANDFSSRIFRSIEDYSRERGVEVFAGSVDSEAEREIKLVKNFASRGVDGLIILPTHLDQSYLKTYLRKDCPVVFVDRPPSHFEADSVLTDNVGGVYEAVYSLTQLGHKRIAYLGDTSTIQTARERLKGYKKALTKAGLEFDANIAKLDLRERSKARNFLFSVFNNPSPPTAIFAARNTLTEECIRVLAELKLQKKVALIGFDELPYADLLTPSISLVTQDIEGIARAAAAIVFERISGKGSRGFEEVRLPTRFIQRDSGQIKVLRG
jgi:LacI family transcriptional regulator